MHFDNNQHELSRQYVDYNSLTDIGNPAQYQEGLRVQDNKGQSTSQVPSMNLTCLPLRNDIRHIDDDPNSSPYFQKDVVDSVKEFITGLNQQVLNLQNFLGLHPPPPSLSPPPNPIYFHQFLPLYLHCLATNQK